MAGVTLHGLVPAHTYRVANERAGEGAEHCKGEALMREGMQTLWPGRRRMISPAAYARTIS